MRSLKEKLEIDLTFFSFSIVPTYITTYTIFKIKYSHDSKYSFFL